MVETQYSPADKANESDTEPERIDDISAWYEQNKSREVTLKGNVAKTIETAVTAGILYVTQDRQIISYEKGDIFVCNPGEDKYRYGSQPTAEERERAFFDSHEKTKDGKYVKKRFQAIPVIERTITFTATNGTDMTVTPGGYVAEGLYGIDSTSAKFYDIVDDEPSPQ